MESGLKQFAAAFCITLLVVIMLGFSAHAAEIEDYKNPYTELMSNLTEEDERLMASCIWYEANNQNIDGQRCVAEVILNRMLSSEWGTGANCSARDVICQKGQFATKKAVLNKGYYTQQQLDVIQIVCEEVPILPSTEYVYFSTSRHKYARDYIKIQDHWFGRGR